MLLTGPAYTSEPSELDRHIRTLRENGVDVIAVGVGESDVIELQKITSDKPGDDDQVWLSKSFDGVFQYTGDIADYSCASGIRLSLYDFDAYKHWSVLYDSLLFTVFYSFSRKAVYHHPF